MRPRAIPALIAVIAMLSMPVSAQNEPKAKQAATEASMPVVSQMLGKLPPKFIYPGDGYYSAELAKTGVQGEVKLELEVTKEKKLLSVNIVASSQSSELDANAVEYVKSENWKFPVEREQEADTRYSFSILFSRDSILTINTKSCADFNTDLDYVHTIRPDDQSNNVAALELIASIYTVQLIKTQGAAEALKYAKAVKAIRTDTINACRVKPDALLIETYVKAARSYDIKF